MSFQEFAKKQGGKPIWLGVAVVGFLISGIGFTTMFINPYFIRRKHRRNEEFALSLLELEKATKQKQESEEFTNS